MSEPKHENESGLIIDPAVLADIRAQCQRRRAELEAAGELPAATIAPESLQSAFSLAKAPLPIAAHESEAARFAAAVSDMPANVRRFFQAEEPAPYRQLESAQDRLEREARSSFGGWCG